MCSEVPGSKVLGPVVKAHCDYNPNQIEGADNKDACVRVFIGCCKQFAETAQTIEEILRTNAERYSLSKMVSSGISLDDPMKGSRYSPKVVMKSAYSSTILNCWYVFQHPRLGKDSREHTVVKWTDVRAMLQAIATSGLEKLRIGEYAPEILDAIKKFPDSYMVGNMMGKNPIDEILEWLKDPAMAEHLCNDYLNGEDEDDMLAEFSSFSPALSAEFKDTEFYKKVSAALTIPLEEKAAIERAILTLKDAENIDRMLELISEIEKLAFKHADQMKGKGRKYIEKIQRELSDIIRKKEAMITSEVKDKLSKMGSLCGLSIFESFMDVSLELFAKITSSGQKTTEARKLLLSILSEGISNRFPEIPIDAKASKFTLDKLGKTFDEIQQTSNKQIVTKQIRGSGSNQSRFNCKLSFLTFMEKSLDPMKCFYASLDKISQLPDDKKASRLAALEKEVEFLPVESRASCMSTIAFLREIAGMVKIPSHKGQVAWRLDPDSAAIKNPITFFFDKLDEVQHCNALNPASKKLLINILINKINSNIDRESWLAYETVWNHLESEMPRNWRRELATNVKQDKIFNETTNRLYNYIDVILADPSSKDNLLKFIKYISNLRKAEQRKILTNPSLEVDNLFSRVPGWINSLVSYGPKWDEHIEELMQLRKTIASLLTDDIQLTSDERRILKTLSEKFELAANRVSHKVTAKDVRLTSETSLQNTLEDHFGDCFYDEKEGRLYLIMRDESGNKYYGHYFTVSAGAIVDGCKTLNVKDKQLIERSTFPRLIELCHAFIKDPKTVKNADVLMAEFKKLNPPSETLKAFFFQLHQTLKTMPLPDVSQAEENLKRANEILSKFEKTNSPIIISELKAVTEAYLDFPPSLLRDLDDLRTLINTKPFPVDQSRPFGSRLGESSDAEYKEALRLMKRILGSIAKSSPERRSVCINFFNEKLFSEDLSWEARNNLSNICILFLHGPEKERLSEIDKDDTIKINIQVKHDDLLFKHDEDPQTLRRLKDILMASARRFASPQTLDFNALSPFDIDQLKMTSKVLQRDKDTEIALPEDQVFRVSYIAQCDLFRNLEFVRIGNKKEEKNIEDIPAEFLADMPGEIRRPAAIYTNVLKYLTEKMKLRTASISKDQEKVLRAIAEKICNRIHQAYPGFCMEFLLQGDNDCPGNTYLFWSHDRFRSAGAPTSVPKTHYNISVDEKGNVFVEYELKFDPYHRPSRESIGAVTICGKFLQANLFENTTVESVLDHPNAITIHIPTATVAP